jgi:2-polyprenyl-3-methyl-5-hydroxy-6-metoxy-1,4-benzoquinol methylase
MEIQPSSKSKRLPFGIERIIKSTFNYLKDKMSNKQDQKIIEQAKIDWNEQAETWDSSNETLYYSNQVFKLLTNKINLNNLDILDFGCGTGLLTDHMTKQARQIVAIDIAEKMIEVLDKKNYKNVKTIIGELSKTTIEKNPELQGKFDLIVASSVCAFVPDYHGVLSIIKSLLKPNGSFFQWDWLLAENESGYGFTKQRITESFESVGLKLDSLETPFYLEMNDEKMEILMAVGKL